MQKITQIQRTVLSLVSAKTLSHFGNSFRGSNIRQCHSLESLKTQLVRNKRVVVVAEFDRCTSRHVDAFISLMKDVSAAYRNHQMKLIVFAKSIDASVYQKFARHLNLMLILEAEALTAPYLTSKFLHGDPVFLRSSPRMQMTAPVLVKTTNWVSQVNLLQKKGRFLDFATQGARLYLPQRLFEAKDYVSVLYQLANEEWVTVECQLRWESSTPDGGQVLGVQFLAIA
ncbi:PilZ domain-containing protein [Bdellovibrio sp. KM01]|uniref:PilZ domain-containing protein n=1 Tax=Bdellovibrio sp. KM01 TaxID=2748865 RepID=UPI0015E95BFC|nr:PilZ domain-containing protein [Bdellovibrio sp. KM01]QLY23804.1 PilZ domain-containing protein [Bdellovibrio sp. KM01]